MIAVALEVLIIFSIICITDTAAYEHIGCYKDNGIRALNDVNHGSGHSVSECSHKCSNYNYFAVQYGSQCFCENNFNDATRYGESNACSNGLGGVWANDLYQNKDVKMICSWDGHWVNDYDNGFDQRYYQHTLSGIESIHDNHKNDRIWKFKTCKISNRNDVPFKSHDKQTSITTLDKYFFKSCSTFNYAQSGMYGIKSDHHNGKNDRDFIFYCGELKDNYGLKNCYWTGFVNTYDNAFKFECNSDGIIRSMASYHDNSKNDRIFSFECCQFADNAPKFANLLGQWDLIRIGGASSISITVGIESSFIKNEETTISNEYTYSLSQTMSASMGFRLGSSVSSEITQSLSQSTRKSITNSLQSSFKKSTVITRNDACEKGFWYRWSVYGDETLLGHNNGVVAIYSDVLLCTDNASPQCPPSYCADDECKTCKPF